MACRISIPWEPLSDVLGVTVLEIMKGERIQEESVDKEEAVSLLSDTLKMSEKEKKRDFIVTVCCSILGSSRCRAGSVGNLPVLLETERRDFPNRGRRWSHFCVYRGKD